MNNISRKSMSATFQFELKIEAKVMSIEMIFSNQRRFEKTNYHPPYQRNYVWDVEKATFFIESILLGTEIPPLIYFNTGDRIEVIDGRQRYETIYRFLDKKFKLKRGGVTKLKDLRNKDFEKLGELKDIFWDTKLRFIEFGFINPSSITPEKEDFVKKEIFKRYNSGITPLKVTEIDKAVYLNNDINSFFKERFKANKKKELELVNEIFNVTDIEKLLKKVRQLLVLQKIPINYFSSNKEFTVEKFFEELSKEIDTENDLQILFDNFIKKLKFSFDIKKILEKKKTITTNLIFECIIWALSILELEEISKDKIFNKEYYDELADYIIKNIDKYKTERSHFYKEVNERYETTSKFFEKKFNINFEIYLLNNESFKEKMADFRKKQDVTSPTSLSKFEKLRLNKPDATSPTIDDIINQMKNERFLIRPPYQRKEVINRIKSSAIIESILLGMKLPPIFIYKRLNGISEVVDGQQRLLSIIGYLGETFLNEDSKFVSSTKDKYSLQQLKILNELSGKRFGDLELQLQEKIRDFALWVIEIDEKNNPDFDPVDLFIRLNYKPYPIKDNTFEMWNSYIDKDIIETIKSIYIKYNTWLYLRKDSSNTRMENEDLITSLVYLEFKSQNININFKNTLEFLDIYKTTDKINI